MRQVEVHRHVNAPVERVWSLATDLEAAPQTLSGVSTVEVLTPGPFGVGTRWRETRTMFGKEATEEMWVTAVDPHRSYTVEAASHGMQYVSNFVFASTTDGGTDVTLTFGGAATSPVSRVVSTLTAPVATRSVAKGLQRDLDDLAAAAERD